MTSSPRPSPSSVAVLLTGAPASGKSTVGRDLAECLGAPFLSLDSVKEVLYAAHDGELDGRELAEAAERRLGDQLAGVDGFAVVDIYAEPGRDTERVSRLLQRNSVEVVEVVCRVPADVAVERYRSRERSGPHEPPDAEALQNVRESVEQLEPLGVGPHLEVDSSRHVDIDSLAKQVRAAAAERPERPAP